MLRHFIALVVFVPLSGCALPPAIAIASYAADGLLLLSSGKTSTDHLLSMAEKRDCAVWRVAKNENICHDFADGKDPYEDWRDPGEVQVAVQSGDAALPVDLAEHSRLRQQAMRDAQIAKQEKAERILVAQAAAGQPVTSARDVVGPSNRNTGAVSSAPLQPVAGVPQSAVPNAPMPVSPAAQGENARPTTAPPADPVAAPVAPVRTGSSTVAVAPRAPGKSGGAYVVIGSYKVEENARRIARQHQALKPTMKAVTVRGERYTRVVAGPYSSADAAAIKQRLKSEEGIDAFIAQSCDGKAAGNCITSRDG